MANIEKTPHSASSQIAVIAEPLMQQLRELIENTRKRVASVVSDETTQLYWNVVMPSIHLCCKVAVQSTENKLSYQCHDNW
ncbi:MAG: hypothetical protein K5660_00640 [Paludibacteraceae bacterium]|nr:hypothetical protein [Paludibacteraceae bacterium]